LLRQVAEEAQRQTDRVEELRQGLQEAAEQRQIADEGRRQAEQELKWLQSGHSRMNNREDIALIQAGDENQKSIKDLNSQILALRNAALINGPDAFEKLANIEEEASNFAAENCRLQRAHTRMTGEMYVCVQRIQQQDTALREIQNQRQTFMPR